MADYTSIHSGEAIDAGITNIGTHIANTSNPHSVTKAQVGLGLVDNTADVDKPVSTATALLVAGHTDKTDNPHSVTATQVGLGNCNNTSDLDKPISTATQTALNGKSNKTTKVTTTMASANWSSNTYSFETTYPSASYNVELELAPTATSTQYKAYGKAGLTGSANTNVVTALGTVPTVDIPVILTVEAK